MSAAPDPTKTPVVVTGGDTAHGEVVRGDVLLIHYDEATENRDYAIEAFEAAHEHGAPAAVRRSLADILGDHGCTGTTLEDGSILHTDTRTPCPVHDAPEREDYTVIGIYDGDERDRFAHTVCAASPAEAEQRIRAFDHVDMPEKDEVDVIVAAVIDTRGRIVG